jgi:predicted aldo/keto reductase-like oxidoreductase
MNRTPITRRRFIGGSAALAATALFSPSLARAFPARKLTAADQVPLGTTGLTISRLGIGTGSRGGRIQRELGRAGFNRLIRHAYDQGITYIDTAENYQTHEWIRDAIKGLPREKLFIQTKIPGTPEKPSEALDRYRLELGVDYFDSVLAHVTTTPNWDDERRRVLDSLDEAKEKQIVRTKGVSCHGLPALKRATHVNWVDVQLVRLNPQGQHMDGPTSQWRPGINERHQPEVVAEIKAMRAQGRGIIGMKLIGNGDFTQPEEREKSIRYAMQSGLLDAAVIGFASTAEIDEAIERINRALAEV